MFNKSIVVALILCACYLGTLQAASVLTQGLEIADTVDQIAQNLPTGAGGLPVPGASNLPIKFPPGGSGSSIPVLGQ